MKYKYTWEVILDDGTFIFQFNQDGTENLWKIVPTERIREFRWRSTELPGLAFSVSVKEGQSCDPARRTVIDTKTFTPEIIAYVVKVGTTEHSINQDGSVTTQEIIP